MRRLTHRKKLFLAIIEKKNDWLFLLIDRDPCGDGLIATSKPRQLGIEIKASAPTSTMPLTESCV